MSDIVERLRRIAREFPITSGNAAWLKPEDTTEWEAADEIERLLDLVNYTVASHHEMTNTVMALATERDALSARLAAAVPEGFVVVPKVATTAMLKAGAWAAGGWTDLKMQAAHVWAAMVEAAGKESKE